MISKRKQRVKIILFLYNNQKILSNFFFFFYTIRAFPSLAEYLRIQFFFYSKFNEKKTSNKAFNKTLLN